MSVPSGSRTNPVIIHIQRGVYKELIYIQREKRFFKLVGENPTNTLLTFNLYAGITNAEGKPIGTFKTPSTTIDADDFSAENLTFENSRRRSRAGAGHPRGRRPRQFPQLSFSRLAGHNPA